LDKKFERKSGVLISVLIAVLVIILMLIISGCRIFGPTDKTKGEVLSPYEAEIHKGLGGLEMTFIKGQPPTSVWEKTNFPITIRIQNRGAYDIQNGRMAITGNLYFVPQENTELSLAFDLVGKSLFNPEGGFSFEEYQATAGEVGADKTDSFFIVACYPYETFASATICINPRVIEIEESAPPRECIVAPIALVGGQGAPVAVTGIDEEIIHIGENKIRLALKISISNAGKGKVVKTDSYDKDCEKMALSMGEVGVIEVKDIQFSSYRLGSEDYSIKCQNLNSDRTFTLDASGKFTLECYADMDLAYIGASAFTTPLTIDLSYGYSQLSDSKSLKIKNSLIV
jgi:hypothetical protein